MTSRYWFMLAAIAVIGGLGLGYSQLMYANGVDPLKDGGLVAMITAVTVAAMKLIPTESK